jgi:hypothetical protein
MAWLKSLLGFGDPYENGPSNFSRSGTFTAETVTGYKICYRILLEYSKSDPEAFKAERMLDEANRDRLVALANEHLVKPAFTKAGCFWRLHDRRYRRGELCCVVKEEDAYTVYRDHSCIEFNKLLAKQRFKGLGCGGMARVELCDQTKDLIEENYSRMIKLYGSDAIEHTGKFMVEEESILVAAAKRALDLEKEFRESQHCQAHSQNGVTIRTHLAGRALQIQWELKEEIGPRSALYGYAKQGGFPLETLPLEANGTCVVDARASGSTVLSLAEGVQHFLTFVVAWKDETGWRADTPIRFSVRIPTAGEWSHAQHLIHRAEECGKQQRQILSKKTSDAIKELLSFVEFEESISEWEKRLIERIASKDYSAEEKGEKIARLREVIEAMRASNG